MRSFYPIFGKNKLLKPKGFSLILIRAQILQSSLGEILKEMNHSERNIERNEPLQSIP